MDKYTKSFRKKLSPSKPYQQKDLRGEGQEALLKGQFAGMERETFFNQAYADILADLFTQWLQTSSDDTATREYLYTTAMALGSVKQKLINLETYGNNIPMLQNSPLPSQEDDDK